MDDCIDIRKGTIEVTYSRRCETMARYSAYLDGLDAKVFLAIPESDRQAWLIDHEYRLRTWAGKEEVLLLGEPQNITVVGAAG